MVMAGWTGTMYEESGVRFGQPIGGLLRITITHQSRDPSAVICDRVPGIAMSEEEGFQIG